jgi:hypothetical protein
MTNQESTTSAATNNVGEGGPIYGRVVIDADRLATAVARAEQLGCVVTNASSVGAGRFGIDVQMSQRAANAVAFAAARGEASFELGQRQTPDNDNLRSSAHRTEVSMDKEQQKELIRHLALGSSDVTRQKLGLIAASPGWRVILKVMPADEHDVAELVIHPIAGWLRNDLGQLQPLLFDGIGQVFLVADSLSASRVVAIVPPGDNAPIEVPDIYRGIELPVGEPTMQ